MAEQLQQRDDNMYTVKLKVDGQLPDQEFDAAFDAMEEYFDILSNHEHTEDGELKETVATVIDDESGQHTYTFRVADAITVDEGDALATALSDITELEFEFDAPIEEDCNDS